MSSILGTDGKPVQSTPEPESEPNNTDGAKSVDEGEKKPTVPLPEQGDMLAGIFVSGITEGEDGHRHVSIEFRTHAALSPMELLTILNEFAVNLQPAAQKQMASSIQKASPEALKQLESMGVKPPGA